MNCLQKPDIWKALAGILAGILLTTELTNWMGQATQKLSMAESMAEILHAGKNLLKMLVGAWKGLEKIPMFVGELGRSKGVAGCY